MKRSHFQDHARIIASLKLAVASVTSGGSVVPTEVIISIKSDFDNHTSRYDSSYANTLPEKLKTTAASSQPIMCRTGVWSWKYRYGDFEVHFCEGGKFVCDSYSAESHWSHKDGAEVFVDWGKYGQYEMHLGSPTDMKGSLKDRARDWRAASFVREHTKEERARFARH
jgi:hypothetical protein